MISFDAPAPCAIFLPRRVLKYNHREIFHSRCHGYPCKAAINNGSVYVLRMVSFWGQEAHLEMDRCPLGTMEEDNDVSAVDLDEETAHLLKNDPQNYVIEFNSEGRPIISVVSHD